LIVGEEGPVIIVNLSRIRIVPVDENHAQEFLHLYQNNKEYLLPWQPTREEEFFTLDKQRSLLRDQKVAYENGTAFVFGIFHGMDLVGRIALTGIERGPFQNGHLGFFVDQLYQNHGIATYAVQQTLNFGFYEASLHRIDAAVMPKNAKSIKVLEKLGFGIIGMSVRHLRIAGTWEDHLLFAITKEDFKTTRGEG